MLNNQKIKEEILNIKINENILIHLFVEFYLFCLYLSLIYLETFFFKFIFFNYIKICI
jgi:hypothetical protein